MKKLVSVLVFKLYKFRTILIKLVVRGDRDSRANLMPFYGGLYQIKL